MSLLLIFGSARVGFGHEQQFDVPTRANSGISIEILCPWSQLPASGFCPVRAEVVNGSSSAQDWTITFTTEPNLTSRVNVGVPAGERRAFDLFVPMASLASTQARYSAISGTIEGGGIEGGKARFHFSQPYRGNVSTAFVLMSKSLATASMGKVETALSTGILRPTSAAPLHDVRFPPAQYSPGANQKRDLTASPAELSELPIDSRTLSGVTGFWLSAADWEKSGAGFRTMVRQWVAGGGQLFVAHEGALPALPGLPRGDGAERPLGLGKVSFIPLQSGELPVAETAKQIAALDGAPMPPSAADFTDDWPLRDVVGLPALNVPVIIGFVLVFAIVIGPVNFMVLAPAGRRQRLFLTVPAISAVASAGLTGLIFITDGLGGTGARNVLLVLMAGEPNAIIVQEQVVRNRLLLSRSFEVPESAAVSLIANERRDESDALMREGSRFHGDWFRSRSVQEHWLRLDTPTRAQVVLQKGSPGAPPTLLSTAGMLLRNVHYVDAAGAFWFAAELPTGRPTTLQPATEQEHKKWLVKMTAPFSKNLSAVSDAVARRAGWFYAEAAPGELAPIETLRAIRWTQQSILCLGTCEKAPELR